MAPNSAARARERRVIWAGVLVTVVGLLLAYGILPFVRDWRSQSASLDRVRAQADSLSALVANSARLEAAAASQETALSLSARRVFRARSATLAASALQSMLQDAADASNLVVTRLDVAQDGAVGTSVDGAGEVTRTDTDDGAATVSLPATLAAYCDVAGLAALLDQLARAPRVVYVDRMTVQQNSALRGAADMLQVTLSLRAPVVLQ